MPDTAVLTVVQFKIISDVICDYEGLRLCGHNVNKTQGKDSVEKE